MGKHDDIVEVNYKDHDIHYINKENQKDHLVEFEEGDRSGPVPAVSFTMKC